MTRIQRLCVYCGSHPGSSPLYAERARELGKLLASRSIGLVYGGSSLGLMGQLADSALEAGGEVIGVIPRALTKVEVPNPRVSDLRVVSSMHRRKALMADLSDAFAALPGGFGTLEELLEVLTWTQLGIHRKPCGILNVEGYYDPMVSLVDRAVEEGFVTRANRALLIEATDASSLIDQLQEWKPTALGAKDRWIDQLKP